MDNLLSALLGATTRIHSSCNPDSPADSSAKGTDVISGCGRPLAALLARQASLVLALHAHLTAPSPAPTAAPPVDEILLGRRLADLLALADARFLAFRFEILPPCWRELYTHVRVLSFHLGVLRSRLRAGVRDEEASSEVDELVRGLDMALIVAGGGVGWRGEVDRLLVLLEGAWVGGCAPRDGPHDGERRGVKRMRYTHEYDGEDGPSSPPSPSPALASWDDTASFSHEVAFEPPVTRPMPRLSGLSMESFQRYIDPATNPHGAAPAVFEDLVTDWPALNHHPWSRPSYLLSRTFGGRRYVPVEIGRSYVDEGWSQKLIPFGTFLSSYIDPSLPPHRPLPSSPPPSSPPPSPPPPPPSTSPSPPPSKPRTGYLAQHDLFSQIPLLRSDILLPDYLWTTPPPHPSPAQNKPRLDTPQLNAWFGPAGTITPLHTDAVHNLLCQVVGRKYVRLYPPECTPAMAPRGVEGGVDMGNTSRVDVGAEEGWDDEDEDGGGGEGIGGEEAERFRAAEYWDCVLGPGDTLYIPIGWWHYVRSLSVSFSVSFWWN